MRCVWTWLLLNIVQLFCKYYTEKVRTNGKFVIVAFSFCEYAISLQRKFHRLENKTYFFTIFMCKILMSLLMKPSKYVLTTFLENDTAVTFRIDNDDAVQRFHWEA